MGRLDNDASPTAELETTGGRDGEGDNGLDNFVRHRQTNSSMFWRNANHKQEGDTRSLKSSPSRALYQLAHVGVFVAHLHLHFHVTAVTAVHAAVAPASVSTPHAHAVHVGVRLHRSAAV